MYIRVKEDYAITRSVADWMESYLSNRYQAIDVKGTSSDKLKLEYGFPQGSKVGPFGFKIYTEPLAAITAKHGVHLHLYAYYIPFDPKNSKDAMLMEACIAEIKSWMASNYLKLNDDKTEFIMFGTLKALQSVSECTVSVGDVEVMPSKTVHNIGAMINSALTMTSHIN